MKKLYRSRTNKILGGVCAGIANYFGIDVVVVRLIWVLLALAGGPGVIGYIIAWIIIPAEPEPTPKREQAAEDVQGDTALAEAPEHSHGNGNVIAAWALIIVGLFFLAERLLPYRWMHWFPWSRLWPALIIVAGLALLLRSRK